VKRLIDADRFQNIKKLNDKLVVEIPESVIRYFGLEENSELEFTIDKEHIIIKECKPVFRAT
jgi:bifunctional DNA-binding transcriptional regulator/antitoxin component of YhaV-PrlF toxin-antitoxin module